MLNQRVILNREDYYRLVNSYNPVFDKDMDLNKQKVILTNVLKNPQSELSLYLRSLSEEDKTSLIAALVSNNKNKIKEMLERILLTISKLDSQILRRLVEHSPRENEVWLNSIVIKMIKVMLTDSNKSPIRHSDTIRIMREAMEQIPDTLIGLPAKKEICDEINSNLKSQFDTLNDIRFSYREPLPILEKAKFNGKITELQFRHAMLVPNMSHSEYIFLACSMLSSCLPKNDDTEKLLQPIRTAYLEKKYERTIRMLQEICKSDQYKIKRQISYLISSRPTQPPLKENTTNYSRRFFENRLAQLYFGQLKDFDFEEISKLTESMINKKVSNLNEAFCALIDLTEISDDHIFSRYQELAAQSSYTKQRGRKRKENYLSKLDEAEGYQTEHVTSRNAGILPSNAPNFPDELTQNELHNKAVDVNAKNNIAYSYPNQNPRVPFVASVSSHAYCMAATFEEYILISRAMNIPDEEITNTINIVLKSFVFISIANGFHSLNETLDPFFEDHIQEVFMRNGIFLDFNLPSELIEQAFQDTQTYTKEIMLRKSMHRNLFQEVKKIPANDCPQVDLPEIRMNKG